MAKAFTSVVNRATSTAMCLLVASLMVVARAGEKAQLTGRWNFNPNVSDDARQKIRDAQQESRHPPEGAGNSYPGAPGRHAGNYPGVGVDTPVPGGDIRAGDPDGIGRGQEGAPIGGAGGGVNYPGGNGGDPGSHRGSGGGNEQGNRGAAVNPAWDWLTRNPKFLQIDQHAKQIVITDDSGHSHTYYPDGKKHEEKDVKGNKISTKAEWTGNSLVTETRMVQSEILTETFRLSEDGSQIYVKTRFETPRFGAPVTVRRVYDVAKVRTN